MAFARHKHESGKRFSRIAGTLGALTVGASLMTAPQAFAADNPSVKQLLAACSWADYCKFHPTSYWTYTGPNHTVGDPVFNCGHKINPMTVSWSDTTSASNNVGVTITLGVKFADTFETEVSVTYGHTWTKSHTDSQSNTVNLDPHWKGWVERGVGKQAAKGWYEIHFGSRYYGHYIWYVNNYQESGWRSTYGYVNLKDKAMTQTEINQHC